MQAGREDGQKTRAGAEHDRPTVRKDDPQNDAGREYDHRHDEPAPSSPIRAESRLQRGHLSLGHCGASRPGLGARAASTRSITRRPFPYKNASTFASSR